MKKVTEATDRLKSFADADGHSQNGNGEISSETNGDLLASVNKIKSRVMILIKDSVLPSMCLFEANPGITSLVWSIVTQFNYLDRYGFYEDWMMAQIYKSPDVLLSVAHQIGEAH